MGFAPKIRFAPDSPLEERIRTIGPSRGASHCRGITRRDAGRASRNTASLAQKTRFELRGDLAATAAFLA